jgi:hypothetical protein
LRSTRVTSASSRRRKTSDGSITAVVHPCDQSSLEAAINAAEDRPDIGYAMIFPGMTIVKILFVDIVPAFLGG